MPGSSLWLLPPGNDPLNRFLSSLIDRTSLHFASEHRFLPHITLTSSIQESKHSTDPQAWLDNLDLPKNVTVKFDRVASEDVFFRKLYVKVVKDGSLTALGEAARKTVEGDESAEAWARDEFMPHLSLMYGNGPKIAEEGIAWTEKTLLEAGLSLNGEAGLEGWRGGRVVLVPTHSPIKDWTPIAERTL